MHERFGAMLKAHSDNPGQALKASLHYMSFPNPPFSARNEAAVNEIVSRAKKLNANLIVFDNLGTISGGADENSYEMIIVMHNLRFVAERTGACVIAIHHDTKHPGPRKSPRGHSSIEASINLALWVDREDDALVFTPTKQRDAPFDMFTALFEYSHKPNTETLLQAKFIGIESAIDAISAKAQSAIVTHLKAAHIANQAKLIEVCKAVKIGRPRAVSEIHRLTRKNIICIKAGQAHNQTLFSLPKEKK